MPGSFNRRNPYDSATINIGQQRDVDYWTEQFGVSEMKLKIAVVVVGPEVKDLRLFFGIK